MMSLRAGIGANRSRFSQPRDLATSAPATHLTADEAGGADIVDLRTLNLRAGVIPVP